MKKILAAMGAALITTMTAWHAYATDASLDKVKKAGKLRIACDMSYPPMQFEDKAGKLDGFDIDFAKELAKRLGTQVDFVTMNWDGILAGLSSNRYDAVICTMNITPDRSKQANFVEYARLAQLYVSPKGKTVASENDLAGKVVAVQADTTSFNYAEGLQKRGIKIKDIKAFKLATDAFNAVKSKQADLIITDEPVGRYYVKQDAKLFDIAGRAMAPEPIGVAMRRDDVALKTAVEKAVTEMKADGTMKKLSMKWFGAELGQ